MGPLAAFDARRAIAQWMSLKQWHLDWVNLECIMTQDRIYSKRGPLFRKKCGAPNIWIPRNSPPRTAFTRHRRGRHARTSTFCWGPVLQCCYCSSSWLIISGQPFWSKNFFVLFGGAPFCGGPVRPNMLNMRKSVSVTTPAVWFVIGLNSQLHTVVYC